MLPGSRERKGIFVNKIINTPKPINMYPITSKGASIFIIEYTIQDEVVNSNVPTLQPYFSTQRTQRKNKNTEHTEIFCC